MRLEVAMDIAVHINQPLLFDEACQILDCVDCRMDPWRWVSPTSVHVETCQTRPVIALNYSIGIQHGYNVYDVVLPYFNCFFVVRQQEVYHAF